MSSPDALEVLGPGGLIARKLPGYEHRPQQLRMAEVVQRAIAAGHHAAVEAGTGTGKSLAYLVPAVLSGKRTICSTANKALQEQIARSDAPFLQTVLPKRFTAVVVKGRSNYLCLHQLAELQARPRLLWSEAAGNSLAAARAWPKLQAWAAAQDRAGESGDLELVDFLVPPELRAEVTVDSDACIGERCPERGRCFAERVKEAAKSADVVIVNHALLLRDLELRAGSDGHVAILPDVDLCVVDEAHHLEDAATDAFGADITEYRWTRLANMIDRLTTRHPALRDADPPPLTTRQAIRESRRRYGAPLPPDNGGFPVNPPLSGGRGAPPDRHSNEIVGTADPRPPPAPLLREQWQDAAVNWQLRVDEAGRPFVEFFHTIATRLERSTVQRLGDETALAAPAVAALGRLAANLREGIPAWLTEPQRESWQRLARQVRTLADHVGGVSTPRHDDRYVRYAQWEGWGQRRRLHLYAKPIDVSVDLRDKLFAAFPTVVATSATLATDGGLAYWRGRVGLDQAEELAAGSPFDFRRNALIYLPADGRALDPAAARTRIGDSPAYLLRLADQLEQLVRASRGRAFALFTSYRTLAELHDLLEPRLAADGFTLLRQGDLPRAELVKRFRTASQAVLFGTRSFWEGVDLPGEALSLVAIDKLPFVPPDDPVFDARKDAINRQHPDEGPWAWWSRLGLPLATLTLKQGFGRLIRTRTDRGVVALLDGRLTTKPYGRKILAALPPATQTRSLDDVRRFFGERPG